MREVNCLGMRCPRPIIEIAKNIRNAEAGESIKLLADDPATEIDLRAWARMTGNHMEVIRANEFLVTKAKVD